MRAEDREPGGTPRKAVTAENARQGSIVLSRPIQRWIFIFGLVAVVLFLLLAY
jgi:hypothetical protein